MCGIRLKGRKRCMDLLLMLGLNETMDQLAMVNSVRSYGEVLRREDVMRWALDLEIEGQLKQEGPKRTW